MHQQIVTHGETGTVLGQLTAVRRDGDDVEGIRLQTTTGDGGWIVFAPDTPGRTQDWQEAEWYRLDGVLGVDPELALRDREERVVDALTSLGGSDLLDDVSATCPVCGGELEDTDALQLSDSLRAIVADLAPNVLGIGQPDLSIESLGSGTDDWRPMDETQGHQIDTPQQHTVVCTQCERDITDYYRDQITEKREEQRSSGGGRGSSGGMQDIVNDALEASETAPTANTQAMQSRESMDVGMAAGGAKDANNFRDNIREGYVPKPDSLAYEGLFYDYYFDTGDETGGDGLFYPSYSTARSEHPLTGDVEQYLTVGLNSNLTEADLERKPLNLVAVVDISGSMGSHFDQYYYDEHGRRHEVEQENGSVETKMGAARQALSALTQQLRPVDQFGVVLYNSEAHVAKPLRPVEKTNMDAIRTHIEDLSARGGTDMSAGFDAAMDLLEPHYDASLTEVENRIVFLTDAMPNTGDTDRDDITDSFAAAAEKNVHTTFVGVGLDTNADLVESISKVRGANHYFIHSTDEFIERLADEFTYMVTPLVFDLRLTIDTDGYEIETVYGSPNADRSTGEVMHVTTLFPSPTADGETRGGVTLLRLRQTDPDASLRLVANWEERNGEAGTDTVELSSPAEQSPHFDNTGIRKAVLLARYGELLREWMRSVRHGAASGTDEYPEDEPVDDWALDLDGELGEWEEQSVPLTVSSSDAEQFRRFYDHFERELERLDDETLNQEKEILDLLRDPEAVAETRAADSRTEDGPDSHPDTCPNCDADISAYGPDAHFCPNCGIKVD